MAKNILITGGAGFIGSHLADQLLAAGHRVRALDCLSPQVHPDGERPDYLDPDVELIKGDVRDANAVTSALKGIDTVYHFAAMVGVGQSMYQVADYTGVNDLGTAVLLQALIERPVERLVVASSMSVYGEGLYRQADGTLVEGQERPRARLERAEWELPGSDGGELVPVPTPESKQPVLSSIYALGKYVQERQCLLIGSAYGIPTTALRFFNVYGTRQALSNPYTGVLAIFASRLLNGKRPMIFEDGRQQRDFVHVKDVANACRLVLESPASANAVLNVGSGRAVSIAELGERLARIVGKEHLTPEVTGRYRVGDIRHCFADIGKARALLGYEPQVTQEEGMAELAEWLSGQVCVDRVDEASKELAMRGLTV
ncbi:NAD-dependent epimerase/dehydratase family protein [Indioceanicola profundi]|uniref:NAD-dependent epimerase/dehydratase family protein n=1 Tax=Indioceanicola profundi TaxID=2220096 RepID=UPI000E6AC5EE|nr:NAD-dependent epimerase/dehydratase family protein [Indioceanicola profundi]